MTRTEQQWIGADIRSLERHRRWLLLIQGDLTSHVMAMGPSPVGQNEVWLCGGRTPLNDLIRSYDMAIKYLVAQYDALEPDEPLAAE